MARVKCDPPVETLLLGPYKAPKCKIRGGKLEEVPGQGDVIGLWVQEPGKRAFECKTC